MPKSKEQQAVERMICSQAATLSVFEALFAHLDQEQREAVVESAYEIYLRNPALSNLENARMTADHYWHSYVRRLS